MSTTSLDQPILDGGLRSPNFFNGRLLSGEDLTAEQAATGQRFCRLGQAVGTGVAEGLQVRVNPLLSEQTKPVLTVSSGLAVSPCGQTLSLGQAVDVALVKARQAGGVSGAKEPFECCVPIKKSSARLAGTGVYLLTICPALAREGRAPVSGLGNDRVKCNSKFLVEGVRFNLTELDVAEEIFAAPNLVRNRVAYECFGTTETKAFADNPFTGGFAQYGLIDQLRPDRLSDCEVPLAVLLWTAANGLQFIDHWSARRRITRPSPDSAWPLLVSDRRLSEGEAVFLQFQEQIEELRESEANLDQLVASQWFAFLPPAGLLSLESVGARPGLSYAKFFEQQAYHPPLLIEGALVEPLMRTALLYRPISLQRKDPIRLFQVVGETAILPYLLFTSALVPFDGAARFDIARWDFANFA